MQRIKFVIRMFMKEPLWFKILIFLTLLISIVYSSSYFSNNTNYQSLAKLSASIFFFTYGIKLRRNLKVSIVFFIFVIICIYLSWESLDYTSFRST
jgi:hypothetical protein